MLAINIEKKDKIIHEAGYIARFRTVCADEYFMRDCLSFELPQIFFAGNAGRYEEGWRHMTISYTKSFRRDCKKICKRKGHNNKLGKASGEDNENQHST